MFGCSVLARRDDEGEEEVAVVTGGGGGGVYLRICTSSTWEDESVTYTS